MYIKKCNQRHFHDLRISISCVVLLVCNKKQVTSEVEKQSTDLFATLFQMKKFDHNTSDHKPFVFGGQLTAQEFEAGNVIYHRFS